MPIGATIGAAVVGAGASVASGSMASHAQSKAANKAADTTLQVADKNNAFAQNMYDQNAARLDPIAARGGRAGDVLMNLLLGEAPTSSGGTTGGTTSGTGTGTGSSGTGSGTGTQSAPVVSQTPVSTAPHQLSGFAGALQSVAQRVSHMDGGERPALPAIGPGSYGSGSNIQSSGGVPSALGTPTPATSTAGTPTGSTGTPATGTGTGGQSALSAWDQFRNSTNYQWRLNQGLDAVGTNYAANGAFESGAEKEAINNYAQNFASNELSNWMSQLYQQEALGATAASSLAGVGTNLVAQVNANNTHAGDAASNAALTAGQASANNFNNIGSAIGTAAGTIGGALSSSYHPAGTYPYGSINVTPTNTNLFQYG